MFPSFDLFIVEATQRHIEADLLSQLDLLKASSSQVVCWVHSKFSEREAAFWALCARLIGEDSHHIILRAYGQNLLLCARWSHDRGKLESQIALKNFTIRYKEKNSPWDLSSKKLFFLYNCNKPKRIVFWLKKSILKSFDFLFRRWDSCLGIEKNICW